MSLVRDVGFNISFPRGNRLGSFFAFSPTVPEHTDTLRAEGADKTRAARLDVCRMVQVLFNIYESFSVVFPLPNTPPNPLSLRDIPLAAP